MRAVLLKAIQDDADMRLALPIKWYVLAASGVGVLLGVERQIGCRGLRALC
jgi:hypothetical protein